MPIVKQKSSIFGTTGEAGYTSPNSSSRNGRINRVVGTVTCAATDLQGSEYLVAQVPSSAIMLPESAIRTTAWGFAQAVIGVKGDTDALLDVAKATGGATGNKPITIFGSLWNKPLWQQLGMAADPGHAIDLIVFTEGDATAAGTLEFDLSFANHV
ncbi:hypothetical protein [Oceaniglobus trochenteri]|uniref:hypothetical protein n=1 Tax=Oceaniglobus trochenteri TaxID=2763260 RepID=UPI001CFF9134|nr:hypothetical protein [Oceaniglobus trochenteri]